MGGRDMRAMEPTSLVYWGAMSASISIGFAVACPMNVWLVQAGLKHGMGTERALGRGGHSMELEGAWRKLLQRGRGIARRAGDSVGGPA